MVVVVAWLLGEAEEVVEGAEEGQQQVQTQEEAVEDEAVEDCLAEQQAKALAPGLLE